MDVSGRLFEAARFFGLRSLAPAVSVERETEWPLSRELGWLDACKYKKFVRCRETQAFGHRTQGDVDGVVHAVCYHLNAN